MFRDVKWGWLRPPLNWFSVRPVYELQNPCSCDDGNQGEDCLTRQEMAGTAMQGCVGQVSRVSRVHEDVFAWQKQGDPRKANSVLTCGWVRLYTSSKECTSTSCPITSLLKELDAAFSATGWYLCKTSFAPSRGRRKPVIVLCCRYTASWQLLHYFQLFACLLLTWTSDKV